MFGRVQGSFFLFLQLFHSEVKAFFVSNQFHGAVNTNSFFCSPFFVSVFLFSSRPALSQFQSLKIRRLANLVQFKNVVRRNLKIQSFERVGWVLLPIWKQRILDRSSCSQNMPYLNSILLRNTQIQFEELEDERASLIFEIPCCEYATSRQTHSHFRSLKIRGLTNFMQFGNVDRRYLRL